MSKQDDAKRLLTPEKPTFLITFGEGGRLDARAMAVVEAEGLKTIWMMTGKSSDKFRQLSENQNCLLYATDLEDSQDYLELRLWGRMELLDDAETRTRVWRDDYGCYFPEGKNDPNLVVLKFTTESGVMQTQSGKEKLNLA